MGAARLQVLFKYEAGYHHNAHGHRSGVLYEAAVCQRLLQPLQRVVPRLYGVDGTAEMRACLVIEYLENSTSVNRAIEPEAIGLAARWIGGFHAAGEHHLRAAPLPFLKPYSEDYYLGWAQRAWDHLHGLCQGPPWLEQLYADFPEAVADLLSAPPTVVHGEYYPQNILWYRGAIYPIGPLPTSVV